MPNGGWGPPGSAAMARGAPRSSVRSRRQTHLSRSGSYPPATPDRLAELGGEVESYRVRAFGPYARCYLDTTARGFFRSRRAQDAFSAGLFRSPSSRIRRPEGKYDDSRTTCRG